MFDDDVLFLSETDYHPVHSVGSVVICCVVSSSKYQLGILCLGHLHLMSVETYVIYR